jgi:hypothetical protein
LSLPVIAHPTYKLKIPSTKKEVPFRPMTVREEKILLLAKESAASEEILMAVQQVVRNCATEELKLEELTIFDLEYLFLKIRARSINNLVKLFYEDQEDGNKVHQFEVDLDKVEVSFPASVPNVIPLTNDIFITMKYPPASLYNDKSLLSVPPGTDQDRVELDFFTLLAKKCVKEIIQGDKIYNNFTPEELDTFFDNLTVKCKNEIQKFFLSAPHLEHVVVYKNSKGEDRKITLTTLEDFFTLR